MHNLFNAVQQCSGGEICTKACEIIISGVLFASGKKILFRVCLRNLWSCLLATLYLYTYTYMPERTRF